MHVEAYASMHGHKLYCSAMRSAKLFTWLWKPRLLAVRCRKWNASWRTFTREPVGVVCHTFVLAIMCSRPCLLSTSALASSDPSHVTTMVDAWLQQDGVDKALAKFNACVGSAVQVQNPSTSLSYDRWCYHVAGTRRIACCSTAAHARCSFAG